MAFGEAAHLLLKNPLVFGKPKIHPLAPLVRMYGHPYKP
jgi:hypothetical protein